MQELPIARKLNKRAKEIIFFMSCFFIVAYKIIDEKIDLIAFAWKR